MENIDNKIFNFSVGKTWYTPNVEFSFLTFIEIIENLKRDKNNIDKTYQEYTNLDKKEKSKIKNHKQFILTAFKNNKRTKSNVISSSGIVFDFDIEDDGTKLKEAQKNIKQSGLNYILYTTLSYNGCNSRFRLVLPFDKPVYKEDFENVGKNIAYNYNIEEFDKASFNNSQAWEYPSNLKDITPIFEYKADGEYIKVDNFKYVVKTKSKNSNSSNTNDNVKEYSSDEILKIIDDYVKDNFLNLHEWVYFISAYFVIVKAYRDNFINETLAIKILEKLSVGNIDWKNENIEKFQKEKDKITLRENTKDFIQKFDFKTWIKEKRKKKLKTYDWASLIMQDINLVKYGNTLYYIDEKTEKYITDDEKLKRLVFSYVGRAETRKIDEIIKSMTYRCKYISLDTEMVVAFNNGYLKDGKFINEIYKEFTPYKISIDYDKNCKPVKIVDDYIDQLTENDKDYRNLLLEVIGHTLITDKVFKRGVGHFFIFVGDGGNGKGTLLQIITEILGKHNISSLSIEDLSTRFRPYELKGKLANLGDDIQDMAIKETHMKQLKNISTADLITVERKGKDPETFQPTTTLIFTSNHLIKSFEKGESYKRRVRWLPMNKKVIKKDPFFINKLTTKDALKYWIKLIIDGYIRLYKNQKLTNSKLVDKFNNNYHNENNPANLYLEDKKMMDFIKVPVKDVVKDFEEWCYDNEYAYSKKFLLDALKEKWAITSVGYPIKINGRSTRVFNIGNVEDI